jgi:acetyl esterase/lipase
MSSVLSRPAPPPDRSFAYGPDPSQVIDIRLPPSGSGPLVVMLHGGFWRSTYDRTHTGPMTSALASLGYVVAIPEYRRTGGGGGWPATFRDVSAALDALDRPIVLMGHSAGGHLALWAAASRSVRAVVSLAGCADLTMCDRLGLGGGATALLMGGSALEVPSRYADADPALLAVDAPVTLLHGMADDVVPIEVSRSYASRTGAELRELPGTGHYELIDPLSSAWPQVLEALPTGSW